MILDFNFLIFFLHHVQFSLINTYHLKNKEKYYIYILENIFWED